MRCKPPYLCTHITASTIPDFNISIAMLVTIPVHCAPNNRKLNISVIKQHHIEVASTPKSSKIITAKKSEYFSYFISYVMQYLPRVEFYEHIKAPHELPYKSHPMNPHSFLSHEQQAPTPNKPKTQFSYTTIFAINN